MFIFIQYYNILYIYNDRKYIYESVYRIPNYNFYFKGKSKQQIIYLPNMYIYIDLCL